MHPSGQPRFVVDYRDLNEKMILDDYRSPLTRQITASLPPTKISRTFDPRSVIRVSPGSESSTAVKTPRTPGHAHGLATAPSGFQRFIYSVLAPFIDLF